MRYVYPFSLPTPCLWLNKFNFELLPVALFCKKRPRLELEKACV